MKVSHWLCPEALIEILLFLAVGSGTGTFKCFVMHPLHVMYLLCFSRYTVLSVITPTGRSSYNQQLCTIGIIPISVLSSDILCCSDPYFCVTYDFFWVHSSPLQYRNLFAGHNSIRCLLYVQYSNPVSALKV